MIITLILVLLITTISCNSQSITEQTTETIAKDTIFLATDQDTVSPPDTLVFSSPEYIESLQEIKERSDLGKTYSTVKKTIATQKQNWKNLSTDSLGKLFEHALVHRIIPYWEGTEWVFEDHTATPQKGQIAYGYFVSTTLLHVGVNINRYKMAQQGPLHEAKTLALKMPVIEVVGESVTENIDTIKAKLPEGIHFVGFDMSHVGYIWHHEGELYLIHSRLCWNWGSLYRASGSIRSFCFFL